MPNQPLINIITINYNNYKGLKKTVESVLKQDYPFIEYIIIDGGSGDESVEYLNQHKSRFAYYVSEPDKGVYDAMNKGIKKSNGDYLLFLNSGDVLINSSSISTLIPHLIPNIVTYTNIELDYGNRIEKHTAPTSITPAAYFKGYLYHQAIIYPKSKIKYYDSTLKYCADWVLNLELMLHGVQFIKADQTFSRYDMSGMTSTGTSVEKALFEKKKVKTLCYPMMLWVQLEYKPKALLRILSDQFILRFKK